MAGDNGKTIVIASTVTVAVTLTLMDAATAAAGYIVAVSNESSVACTIARATASNTISGVTSDYSLPPFSSVSFVVSPSGAGYTIRSHGLGAVIQRGYAEYAANADLTTTIPADDSIPQQTTEGTMIASVAFTPRSAFSRIRIRAQGFMSGANTAGGTLAVFVDSTANAIGASVVTFSTAAPTIHNALEFEFASGSTTARTYKLHAGGTGTIRMNGSTSARYFGGIAKTTLIVEEIL